MDELRLVHSASEHSVKSERLSSAFRAVAVNVLEFVAGGDSDKQAGTVLDPRLMEEFLQELEASQDELGVERGVALTMFDFSPDPSSEDEPVNAVIRGALRMAAALLRDKAAGANASPDYLAAQREMGRGFVKINNKIARDKRRR